MLLPDRSLPETNETAKENQAFLGLAYRTSEQRLKARLFQSQGGGPVEG